jgi:hypothetical protein
MKLVRIGRHDRQASVVEDAADGNGFVERQLQIAPAPQWTPTIVVLSTHTWRVHHDVERERRREA